jgi:hypothetical protein
MVLQGGDVEPFSVLMTDVPTSLPIPLHTKGSSQCPLVDKAHICHPLPAPCLLSNYVAQVVWNFSSVANRYNWQFSQDTLSNGMTYRIGFKFLWSSLYPIQDTTGHNHPE